MFDRLRATAQSSTIDLCLLAAGAFVGLLLLTLYAQTLSYDATVLPNILKDIVPWQYGNLKPEPWEPQLYHLGAVLIPLASIALWLALKRKMRENSAMLLAATTGVIWFGILLWLHPTAREALLGSWQILPWQGFFFARASVIVALIVTGALWWLQKKMALPEAKWMTIVEGIAIVAFAAWLAYDPLSLSGYREVTASDHYWFMVPAADILQGKHLLIDSASQYGFLPFYLLAAAFKVFGVSITTFKAFLMVLHFAYYILLYVLVRNVFEKRSHAVLAYACVLGFTIMRNETRSEMYDEPSITRWRNFLDVPVILLFIAEMRTGKRIYFVLATLFAGIAFFWNTDMGLSIALMTAAWAVLVPLCKEQAAVPKMELMRRAGTFLCAIAAVNVAISLALYVGAGTYPAWYWYISFTRLYSAGFGAMPMPVLGAQWAVLGILGASVIIGLYLWMTRKMLSVVPLLLSIAGYGLLTFHYYLNRSFIANIWVIGLAPALCLCVLFAMWDAERPSWATPAKWIVGITAGILCIFSVAAFIDGASMTFIRRSAVIQPQVLPAGFEENMRKDVEAIQTLTTPKEGVAIISLREGVFLLEAHRKSAFQAPIMDTVFTITELKVQLQAFVDSGRPYLFIERSYENCPRCDAMKEMLSPFFTLDHQAGYLDVYKRNTR